MRVLISLSSTVVLTALAAAFGALPPRDAPRVEVVRPAGAFAFETVHAPPGPLVGAGGRTFYVSAARGDDANPGTAAQPWRTIGRAAGPGVLRPGDLVRIAPGVYREGVRPAEGGTGPDARVTFAAEPGGPVVLSGVDPADDGWTPAPDVHPAAWRRAWTGPDLPTYDPDPTFRRQLVVAGGRVLRPVPTADALAPGTFTAEGSGDRPRALVARFPADASPRAAGPVEVGARSVLFSPVGDDPDAACGAPGTPGWIRLVGVTLRHATNRAQQGALCLGSEGSVAEDVAAEWTNGRGIDSSGRGHVFRRVRADHHGQMGWGGACTGCLFEDGGAEGNNWKGHDPFWEAGGGKWVGTSATVFRRMTMRDNGGPGLWLDGDNDRNTVEGVLAEGNEVAGILLELRTTRTLVQHCVARGTRWRGWSGAGILSQAASENVYLHNTLEGNEGAGLWLRLDPERRAPDGADTVVGNRIVGNGTRAGVETRSVSVEAASAARLRATRWAGNVYGPLAGASPDPVLRSTFFALPVGRGDLRTDDFAAWSRATGDAGSRVGAPLGAALPAAAARLALDAGAPAAPPRRAVGIGADRVGSARTEPEARRPTGLPVR